MAERFNSETRVVEETDPHHYKLRKGKAKDYFVPTISGNNTFWNHVASDDNVIFDVERFDYGPNGKSIIFKDSYSHGSWNEYMYRHDQLTEINYDELPDFVKYGLENIVAVSGEFKKYIPAGSDTHVHRGAVVKPLIYIDINDTQITSITNNSLYARVKLPKTDEYFDIPIKMVYDGVNKAAVRIGLISDKKYSHYRLTTKTKFTLDPITGKDIKTRFNDQHTVPRKNKQ